MRLRVVMVLCAAGYGRQVFTVTVNDVDPVPMRADHMLSLRAFR